MKFMLKNSMIIACILACLCLSSAFAESSGAVTTNEKNGSSAKLPHVSTQEQSDNNVSESFREEVK